MVRKFKITHMTCIRLFVVVAIFGRGSHVSKAGLKLAM